MSDPGAVGTPELRLRTMRVVVGALCAGVLSFAAIAVWVRTSGGTPPPPTPLISYVSLAFAGVAVLLALFLPGALAASWRRQVAREGGAVPPPPGEPTGTDLRWWGFFQTRLIVRCALLEGAGFAQLVAYLIEGQPWSLAVALVLLAVLAFNFPTRDGVERWVQAQQALARDGR